MSRPSVQDSRAGLTRRELEVVTLTSEGLSGREVATKLCRSPRTIENHLRSAYQKLGVRNRVEMVRKAGDLGLLGGSTQHPETQKAAAQLEIKGHALESLIEIYKRLADCDNHNYFGELASALSDVFGTRWSGMCEADMHSEFVELIVFIGDGEAQIADPCPRSTSACGRTLDRGTVSVLSDAAAAFPESQLFKDMGVQAYVGVRLDDRLMGPVGTLWVMDDKPIDPGLGVPQVLAVLAPRTAAELALARTLDEESDGPAGDIAESATE